jgi:methylated-DNA-[protein]-cysteine S-methyltransferase
MNYQVCVVAPFAVLGIRCREDAVTGIDFLPLGTALVAPSNGMADQISEALRCYLRNPLSPFELPLELHGTPFQRRVWDALRRIPASETVTYAELARQLGSGARAVANACGANPLPIVIACHRVVAKNGLGGFMRGSEVASLEIKRWLLNHERSTSSPA